MSRDPYIRVRVRDGMIEMKSVGDGFAIGTADQARALGEKLIEYADRLQPDRAASRRMISGMSRSSHQLKGDA